MSVTYGRDAVSSTRHTREPMEIAFATRDLRAMCEDLNIAQDVIGMSVADQLRARLADMRAADNVEELLGLGVTGVRIESNRLTVELAQGYRIVLRSNHEVGRRGPERPEWRNVRRVQVLTVDKDAG